MCDLYVNNEVLDLIIDGDEVDVIEYIGELNVDISLEKGYNELGQCTIEHTQNINTIKQIITQNNYKFVDINNITLYKTNRHFLLSRGFDESDIIN